MKKCKVFKKVRGRGGSPVVREIGTTSMPTKDVEERHIVVEDNLPLATPSIVYGGGAVRKTRTELIQSRQEKHSRHDWEDRDTENPL